MEDKMKIIVLGKNYLTPLTVIRSLGKAGYPADVFLILKNGDDIDVVRRSVYTGKCLSVPKRDDEKIIGMLKEEYRDDPAVKVLFPTDDSTASLIDRYREALRPYFLMPYAEGMTITSAMDKSFQAKTAAACGLNTASSWIISLENDEIAVPDDIVYPCFVKPLLSARGGKADLGKCPDEKALRAKLRKLQEKNRDRSILVQEFLSIRREYTAGGVCCGREVFMPALIRKSRVAEHNRGVTLSGTMVPVSELSAISEQILSFLREMRFYGMFDLEIMETDRGYYFGELNLRSGGPSYAYFRCGTNLPELAVKAVVSGSVRMPENRVETGKSFVNDKVLWEDFAYGHLSEKERRDIISAADFTLLEDADDPKPGEVFREKLIPQYRKKRLKVRAKRLLRPVLKTVGK